MSVQIEMIDLSQDKIIEPENAYVIEERRFGIASPKQDRSYLITKGLCTCKGISFYSDEQQFSGSRDRHMALNLLTGQVREIHLPVGARNWSAPLGDRSLNQS